LRKIAIHLALAIISFALFVSPIQSTQQSTRTIFSQGTISLEKGGLSRLHTDGAYIRNEAEEIVSLRGCAFIEPAYRSDTLGGEPPGTLAQRAERFKELGVNYVRLEIDQAKWDENRDTNGDGIGNRNFTMQAIQEFTSRGIYVIPGLHGSISPNFYTDTQAWIDWLINNLVTPNLNNPGVAGIYIMNEPRYDMFGGTGLGGGVPSGYWDAVKEACRQIHAVNLNLLIVVHADTANQAGFCPVLRTDPIPVPNVVYTWHYYYMYNVLFNPYLGWMSGVLDPDYQEFVNRGIPFVKDYTFGNMTLARQEFEQYLYNRFLWVPNELNLPIINDEFAFTGSRGDENTILSFKGYRACATCLANNGGVPQMGKTFWFVSECYSDPALTTKMTSPYRGTCYDPLGHAMPEPHPGEEPGWPQVMHDFLQILNKYNCNWSYYAWWGATYDAGYGLTTDMYNLTERGEIWNDYLNV
jgi:hypothetical protein